MNSLINDVIDGQNQSYKLYVEIKNSSLNNYCDIEFYSTFSGAEDKTAKQTKWKTTLPLDSLYQLKNCIDDYIHNTFNDRNDRIVIDPSLIGIRDESKN